VSIILAIVVAAIGFAVGYAIAARRVGEKLRRAPVPSAPAPTTLVDGANSRASTLHPAGSSTGDASIAAPSPPLSIDRRMRADHSKLRNEGAMLRRALPDAMRPICH
jgi:hypothetical protein